MASGIRESAPASSARSASIWITPQRKKSACCGRPARAQIATGAPLTTHASMYPVGLLQLDILRDEGVDPSRVIIGHCDTYLEQAYHLSILEAGAWVQFDTIGRVHMNPDYRRVSALVELIRLGWRDQLLLSSDRCHRGDLCAFGGVGYGYVFTRFFDMLRAAGIDDARWMPSRLTTRGASWLGKCFCVAGSKPHPPAPRSALRTRQVSML